MTQQFHVTKVLQDAASVLDTKEFRDAIKKDLSSLPSPSPGENFLFFFENIPIPYNHLRNAQYSLAIDSWEKVLKLIKEIDVKRFKTMHKGTPYYFCGIAAYMMEDYERAVFYFDAALAEDVKNYSSFGGELKKAPAVLFLTLNDGVPDQAAKDLVKKTKELMGKGLAKFRKKSLEQMDLAELDNLYLSPSVTQTSEWRSSVTALFSYVLEGRTRRKEFALKSAHGGTREPFFLYLFKGCLIFETLLKLPQGKAYQKKTLGSLLKEQNIASRLGISQSFKKQARDKTFDEVVNLCKNWRVSGIPFNDRVVWTTYGIRNTTGHNLSWDTQMSGRDFNNLADDILFAIFLAILKLL
ncbi:MAG: hypothetical protein ACLPX5_08855 [Dissulfurispiraceae bacterium]